MLLLLTCGITINIYNNQFVFGFSVNDSNQNFNRNQLNLNSSSLKGQSTAGLPFNPGAPLTLPLLEGYHNGTKVFFINSEISDKKMAQRMSSMTNFPVLFVPSLANISVNSVGKEYVFTNGLPSTRTYDGGPYGFQLNIFDSIPGAKDYSNFKTLYLVTWMDPTSARVLDSAPAVLDAQARGEVTIKPTNITVNSPIISWMDRAGAGHTSYIIDNILQSMPGFKAQVLYADIYNYIVKLRFLQVISNNPVVEGIQ
jgi:hypothetical protein